METYKTLNIKIFISFVILIYSSFAFAEDYKTENIQSQLKLFYQAIQNNSEESVDENELFSQSMLKNRLSYLTEYKSSKSPVLDYFKQHNKLLLPQPMVDSTKQIHFSQKLNFQRLNDTHKINNLVQILIRINDGFPQYTGMRYYIITFEGENSKGLPLINPDLLMFCNEKKPGMISDFAYEAKE